MNGLFGDPQMMGLLGMASSLLKAGAPSTTPNSFAGGLGQGLLGGMQGYGQGMQFQGLEEQNALRKAQMEELKRKALAEEEMRRIRAGLLGGFQPAQTQPVAPPPIVEQSASGPVTSTPVAFHQPEARPLDAPAPSGGGFQPIPVGKLAQAAAAGIDIKPFIALNNEARPDVMTVDAGDKIRLVDKKTMRVIEEVRKGSAPGSRPFEASDLTPAQYREHQVGKAKAGAPTIDARVSQGVAGEVKEIISASHAAASGAVSSLETLSNVERAITSGNVNLGPGANIRTRVDQVAQWLGVGGKDTEERLVNTSNVIRGLAQSTLNARKALKGQGSVSDHEGRVLEKAASGNIDEMTIPELKDFVKLSRRMAEKVVSEHKRQLKNLSKTPDGAVLVPFFDVPGPSEGNYTISPEAQRLIDKYAPR